MKKYIIILLLLFSINTESIAEMSIHEKITAIENTIFGYDYKDESDEN